MRALAFAILLAGCGGSPPPPASPTPSPAPTPTADSAPAPDPAPAPAPEPEPAPPPQPPPPKPVAERLPDDSGEVAGLAGWKIERKPDANHCSGMKIITTRGKKKLSADDQPLANVYALTFPTGLNFEPGEKNTKKREDSLKKFSAFVEKMMKVGGDATKFYEGWLRDDTRDAQAKINAAARMAQIQIRIVSLLARAEIPKDVRTGEFANEKVDAFCSKMTEVAEPLMVRAEETMKICAEKATQLQVATGWWAAVCTAP